MPDSKSPGKKIRIGLVGAGTWALHGHVRVLNLLAEYELVAVYARRREVAEKAASDHGFRFVANTVAELCRHPEVDLVVVATTTPEHADPVKMALEAGKDVYCEWPLTTNTDTAQELLELAQRKNARHAVGLQRRLAPHNRYLKDLLARGWIGEIRSIRVHVSIPLLGAERGKAAHWTAPVENFSNVVSIYAGHFLDMVFEATGWPDSLSALQKNQFPTVLDEEGQKVMATSPDQLVLIGKKGTNTLVTAHIESGKANGFGVQIDITGREGDLRITNRSAFGEVGDDYIIQGSNNAGQSLKVLDIPLDYEWISDPSLPSAVLELGHLYKAFAEDLRSGSHTAATFADALRLHRFFDTVQKSTDLGGLKLEGKVGDQT